MIRDPAASTFDAPRRSAGADCRADRVTPFTLQKRRAGTLTPGGDAGGNGVPR